MTDTLPSALPDDAIFCTPVKRHAARLDARLTMSSVAIVSAHGDIDGTNANTLTEYALANVVRCRGLILDLSCLEFFGTEGFSALHRVSVCCARGNRLGGGSWCCGLPTPTNLRPARLVTRRRHCLCGSG